jgi:biopolymer transport protein ExbD
MHGRHTNEDEPMAQMNLIPLIDIALTLLIILMVTTAFVRQPGVKMNLPQTVTREGAPETRKDMIIAVTADSGLWVDGQKLTPGQLQTRLMVLGRANKQARVLLKGDRGVVYARMMDVIDMVRQAGLSRLVLPTSPKLGQPALPTSTPQPEPPKPGPNVASRP